MSMREYLELEIPHYLEDTLVDCRVVGNFQFQIAEGIIAESEVYEVLLGSGRKVFAVEGGWKGKGRNVYAQKLPDAETAAKVHIFTMLKVLERQNPEAVGIAEDIAGDLKLPEQFRKTH